MTKTTKESAADLRVALKAHGWNSRKVSIRVEYFSMGSAVEVTVRAITVDFAKVKELAIEHCESIARDESGDILSGGNTFVRVCRTRAVEGALAAKHFDAVKAAIEKLDENDPNKMIEVEGVDDVQISVTQNRWSVRVWMGESGSQAYSKCDDGVRSIAVAIADARRR